MRTFVFLKRTKGSLSPNLLFAMRVVRSREWFVNGISNIAGAAVNCVRKQQNTYKLSLFIIIIIIIYYYYG